MDISASSSYKDFKWAMELHRFGFEILGLWPKNDKLAKRSLLSKFHTGIILILLIFVCNIPMVYAITQVWGDMILVINNLQTTLPVMAASVKYIIMQWKRTVLLSIVNMMAEDWMAIKLATERDIMVRRARTARLIMTIGYILLVIAFLIITIPSYFGIQISNVTNLTEKKQLPFQTYHFYDVDKSPQFELTFFIQVITTLLAGFSQICTDLFLILIVLHICGQLENLRYRLNELVSCKNFNKTLNDIIARHLRLIRFAENIEKAYSLLMLMLVFHFGIIFCLSSFLCIIVFNEATSGVIAQIFYSTIIASILFMDTFFYCGAGELITEQCNIVHRSLCDLEWYTLESKEARNLILLMIRTSHPFHITAGKIIPLTMATFCSILKTSSGYISILLTMGD